MKTKRYSTEQIISILKEGEAGMPVKDLCRKWRLRDVDPLPKNLILNNIVMGWHKVLSVLYDEND